MHRTKKKTSIIFVLMCLLPLAFQMDNIRETNILYRILYLALFLVYAIEYHLRISRKTWKKLLLVITVYLLFPILSFRVNLNSLLYFAFVVIFFFDLEACGAEFEKNRVLTLFWLIVSNGSILLIQIARNINEINNKTIQSMFSGSRFFRAWFGYSHPNFAAMFMVVEMLLIYVYSKETKKWQVGMIGSVVLMIPLFATGSRTALYSIAFFVIIDLAQTISYKLRSKTRIIYLFTVLFAVFAIISSIGSDVLNDYAFRLPSLQNNLAVLMNNSGVLFGLGGGSTSSVTSIDGVSFSDNWFVTCIINYGVCGLILMMIFIISLLVEFIRRKYSVTTISILLFLLIYSIGENVLFTPGVSLSFIAWLLIMAEVSRRKDLQYE